MGDIVHSKGFRYPLPIAQGSESRTHLGTPAFACPCHRRSAQGSQLAARRQSNSLCKEIAEEASLGKSNQIPEVGPAQAVDNNKSCPPAPHPVAKWLGIHALLLYLADVKPSLAETATGKYVPQPYQPGWEVWVGAIAAAIPFVIGSWEFGKRILIQRRCQRCGGSGLVKKRKYRTEMDVRKCPDCGGFFPWQGWGRFFTSTAAPGNGGPLQQPKGQTSIFYKVPERTGSAGRELSNNSQSNIDNSEKERVGSHEQE